MRNDERTSFSISIAISKVVNRRSYCMNRSFKLLYEWTSQLDIRLDICCPSQTQATDFRSFCT